MIIAKWPRGKQPIGDYDFSIYWSFWRTAQDGKVQFLGEVYRTADSGRGLSEVDLTPGQVRAIIPAIGVTGSLAINPARGVKTV